MLDLTPSLQYNVIAALSPLVCARVHGRALCSVVGVGYTYIYRRSCQLSSHSGGHTGTAASQSRSRVNGFSTMRIHDRRHGRPRGSTAFCGHDTSPT
eukprot:294642-Prymnesium_polylepis.2